jgi:hypothetical protein
VTEALNRIAEVRDAAGNGTGSANRKGKGKRARRADDHDTVAISEEAKRLLALEELDVA